METIFCGERIASAEKSELYERGNWKAKGMRRVMTIGWIRRLIMTEQLLVTARPSSLCSSFKYHPIQGRMYVQLESSLLASISSDRLS